MTRLLEFRRSIGESSILIKTDLHQAAEAAFQNILENRNQLQEYIRNSPEFLLALDPVPLGAAAPEVVIRMSQAAELAGVGPMAAVAGALADLAVEEMLRCGAKVAVVENGGEVSIRGDAKLDIAVYSGKSQLSRRLGFRVLPEDLPLGLATSSGTVGHALSFGLADSATVFADNAALADAAATAVCNRVNAKDVGESVKMGLNTAHSIVGVKGSMIIRGDHVGTVGWLPKLIRIN